LLKAFVRRVNRRIDIRIVILALDVARGEQVENREEQVPWITDRNRE